MNQLPGLKFVEKNVPKSKGLVQTAITGVGFDAVAKVVDGFVGAPLQRFGITLPVMGRVSIIDFVNFAVHNRGLKLKKEGFIAVGSAKLVQTGFNVGSLNLSGAASPAETSGPQGGGL